jgi:hypothetical protein
MIRQRIMTCITTMAMALLSATPSALAADDGKTPISYGGFWITLLLVYFTRKRKIGGWLFYYYFQTYVGLLVLFIILASSLQNYQPSVWEDKALYTLFIVSTVPSFLLKFLEVTIASLLLSKRNRKQQFINYLKYVLITEAVVAGLTLFIDYNHFPDTMAFTTLGIISGVIWYLYFRISFRVYYVLSHSDWHWNYDDFKRSKSQGKQFSKVS